jgi:hypothetical protein
MDLHKVKSVSPNRNLFKKIAALLFSILVVAVSFIMINNANEAAKNTVDVLRIKSNEGLAAYVPIAESHIEKYSVIRKEYTDDMVLAEDKENVIGKMPAYFLRKNSILFKDQLVAEKPLRNDWLYRLAEDQEVLTIPYDYLEAGGAVLLPGDKIRIRVSYESEEASGEGGEENPNMVTTRVRGKTIKTEILFEDIEIKDMLNANSHSIYEVYKEVMKLSEDKRRETMRSESFLKSVVPRSLLLAGTKEQMNHYAKFKSADGKAFLITILSRANSQIVLDQLPGLENEVTTWIEEKKGN